MSKGNGHVISPGYLEAIKRFHTDAAALDAARGHGRELAREKRRLGLQARMLEVRAAQEARR